MTARVRMNLMQVRQRARPSKHGLAIVWCHCDVINNSKNLSKQWENADIKLLTETQAKFPNDPGYFRCLAVVRGPPIRYE